MSRNPVAGFYETWWIAPDGEVYDAVRRGIPGHCGWLEERFGICSREDARRLGWVRVGWNLQEFYVEGRPERLQAERERIEELLLRHPEVVRVVVDTGGEMWTIVTPHEFFDGRVPWVG